MENYKINQEEKGGANMYLKVYPISYYKINDFIRFLNKRNIPVESANREGLALDIINKNDLCEVVRLAMKNKIYFEINLK